ncbi:MAG: polysaccharide deacetylase family protein [Desulfobulbales bacterium]|nr:polysaccharide deacetylase family protein [Desulfobulbales bacterium]
MYFSCNDKVPDKPCGPVLVRLILFGALAVYTLICSAGCGSPGEQNKESSRESRLVVLNYHNIGNHDELYAVSRKQFVRQVKYLVKQGYAAISLAEFRSWRQGDIKLPEKVFMLTFDDGNLSDYETVYPFLKKQGLKGVFFLKTKALDTAAHLNTAQIKEMSDSGLCEFGSHSVHHQNFIGMEKNMLDQELTVSRNVIQSITGREVYAFAYPNGFWNGAAKKALMDNGYHFAFTVLPGLNERTTNPLELRRIVVKRDTSQQVFIDWINRKPELYKKYYTELLQKADKDGLTAVAKVSREELRQ